MLQMRDRAIFVETSVDGRQLPPPMSQQVFESHAIQKLTPFLLAKHLVDWAHSRSFSLSGRRGSAPAAPSYLGTRLVRLLVA